MPYLDFPVTGRAGDLVVVDLHHQANVRLVDETNLNRFARGQTHQHYGGRWARTSPVRIRLPRSGRFHVIVDAAGRRADIRASVRLLTRR